MSAKSQATRVRYHRVAPMRPVANLADDVRAGLLSPPRWLPPKYFYDDNGSRLFEAICGTEEYYPTRAESALLAEWADQVIRRVSPAHLIELGSGNSQKTRHLIAACDRAGVHARYWPFDVSGGMMRDAVERLVADYAWLRVDAMIGDYNAGLANLPLANDGARRLFLFLGSTIGNFEPNHAEDFLAEIRALMASGDALLIGLDRIKDLATLEAAYDDASGYTAAFNKNVLNVLNRELGGDIPVDAYRHRALFDIQHSRIEMRLVAERAHRVRLTQIDAEFDMAAGEEILTEISRKFSRAAITDLLAGAGLREVAHFTDDNEQYSLILAVRA